ncbi:MAG: aldehyde dehydrogenase family protein, partial [Candidatus Binatia bacterium]
MAKMFIGGESVGSVTNNTSEVRNPATGATVDTVPQGNDKDVQQAISAAEDAFKVWADVSPEDRGNALMNAGELIKKNTAEIAQLLTQEQGKTLFEAGLEIHHLVHGLEFYAGLASKVRGSHVPLPQKNAYGMVVRQPIGVCGGIVPWNFPLTLMGTKLGPALAAGNTIIIKPASTTPLATIKVIELIAQATFGEGKAQKPLPKGTVNIVTGPGGSVGEELLRNPRVRRIAFTGSTPIGRHVMEVAGREIKRVTLELGGSDPMIVMEDSNVDLAVKMADVGRYFNCGQMCLGVKRLFLQESIADNFIGALVEILKKKTVGNGMSKETRMGPIHVGAQRQEVEEQVEDAKARGGKVLFGGERPKGAEFDNGFYYLPTLMTNVP